MSHRLLVFQDCRSPTLQFFSSFISVVILLTVSSIFFPNSDVLVKLVQQINSCLTGTVFLKHQIHSSEKVINEHLRTKTTSMKASYFDIKFSF